MKPDHMHIFVDVTQIVAPHDVVRAQKSISSTELFKVFPKSKQFYAGCGIL
ncbi:transposase [Catenibacterium mitsuokai]|uniref:Transposase n=1 Tax=Catenibacterium mitsuokai TaxID=100886 RepID=A0AAW4MTT7_9FIRM|nr:transposase [Catenibacterium mitsuokai]MBV3371690.1 transposase [Catenibacterium mitsuokai]MBV3377000.1 transposase [Catenibacterium mitsuokai]MBV3379299.1 transposase [Catenibacterium mitsuokai]MBV3381529.1 transposase [Catenibacterium mitsuokai]